MSPKNIPSHTTQLSTGYRQLFTYNLGPFRGWAKGLGPACTPTSLGSDPPPALLGPQGPEYQASGGGGSDGSVVETIEPQWDRQKQGHRDSNQDPELSPRGPGRLWPVHRLSLKAGGRHCPHCRLRCRDHGCKGIPSLSGKQLPAGCASHHARSVSPAGRCLLSL